MLKQNFFCCENLKKNHANETNNQYFIIKICNCCDQYEIQLFVFYTEV